MKHMKTSSEEEANAKKAYTKVENTAVVADDKTEEKAKELLRTLVQIDELKLQASRLTGALMNAMKNSDTLKSKDGNVIAYWTVGNTTKSVDYEGLMAKYGVTAEDIKKYTTEKVGSRRFSLEIGD